MWTDKQKVRLNYTYVDGLVKDALTVRFWTYIHKDKFIMSLLTD